ncbi:MAG: hypothetical protein EXQ60_00870 [Candidatus Nanopelagicales bacterium]|nr:hypothetical protein [Candidatus Nanopelagicales bacterium]
MIVATFYRWLPSGDAEVATEDGDLLQVTAQLLAASAFRRLRVGQRLAVKLSPTGIVISIDLPN